MRWDPVNQRVLDEDDLEFEQAFVDLTNDVDFEGLDLSNVAYHPPGSTTTGQPPNSSVPGRPVRCRTCKVICK